uniref:Uncharacterized protein n=1 Tax=Chromera velia CCMP2878 TaxID=1169474 RepID=A0A0G4HQE3_9ALVE|mmetsp:Transcript_17233/g.34959  ORF Transcript_17233/g.34959 Transcript_17233/m.34959 type:complete len:299 (+) Transcript_17233:183-1079(+)|eukprot:Cvel_7957.t1-p1 / transcript=Cvel_7957.t1 / gene=Cvel_7957 / organism=Chromera_velia_CCMP2878 / gene_product=hypothetical protein / transcript_product=hypothetical protein / location=Cvel_scaffold428:17610-18503(+) / protein_length=298 / sequence_SO=supercontig / SO=protein_coding / is_pseudo=false
MNLKVLTTMKIRVCGLRCNVTALLFLCFVLVNSGGGVVGASSNVCKELPSIIGNFSAPSFQQADLEGGWVEVYYQDFVQDLLGMRCTTVERTFPSSLSADGQRLGDGEIRDGGSFTETIKWSTEKDLSKFSTLDFAYDSTDHPLIFQTGPSFVKVRVPVYLIFPSASVSVGRDLSGKKEADQRMGGDGQDDLLPSSSPASPLSSVLPKEEKESGGWMALVKCKEAFGREIFHSVEVFSRSGFLSDEEQQQVDSVLQSYGLESLPTLKPVSCGQSENETVSPSPQSSSLLPSESNVLFA